MKTEQKNKGSVTGGLFWSFLERIASQLVSTIVGIILARLLSPDEYGIIAIVMIFITLSDVFVTSGFGTALVQKKEIHRKDYDTAFWFSFAISVVLYLILFVSAPYIAYFYEIELLTPVIRVFAIRLLFASLNTVQVAKVQREMAFRKYFISTFIGTAASCVIGVIMALAGCGVWALVAQYLSNTIIASVVFAFYCGWNPRPQFSFDSAKSIWRFGSKVLGANLISTGVVEIQSFFIGKVFGAADLAYIDQGKKYPSLLVTNINSSVSKVMLPAFSENQDDHEKIKADLRKTIRVSNYVLSPLLLGFCAVAPIFVDVVLTDKWADCVPYIQIFCIMFLTRPLTMLCHQALLAIDKGSLAMAIMAVINAVALVGIAIAVFAVQSVILVPITLLIADFVSLGCFMVSMKKTISYDFKEQLADILPAIIISLVMYAAVALLGLLNINHLLLLALQVFLGIGVYMTLSALFGLSAFTFIVDFVKVKLLKRG